jgi:hypothetical protein
MINRVFLDRVVGRVRRKLDANVVRRTHAGAVQTLGGGWLTVATPAQPEPRRGLFLCGACDMLALFAMHDPLARRGGGTYGVAAARNILMTRPDVLLQTLDAPAGPEVREILDRLRLHRRYFRPTLFEPDFTVSGRMRSKWGLPGRAVRETFRKDVVVLSTAAGLVRSLIRHKKTGLLVDPGGRWFEGRAAIADAAAATDERRWIRENFTSEGRLSTSQHLALMRELVEQVRRRTGARVVIFNALSVEPGNPVHTYGNRSRPEPVRRRETLIGLAELGRDMGVPIVDVDAALKRAGIAEAVDFAHFPPDRCEPVAAEAYRVLDEAGLLE